MRRIVPVVFRARPAGRGRAAQRLEPLPPASDPREAALRLVQAAQTGRSTAGEIAALVHADLPSDSRIALAQVFDALRRTRRARILAAQPLGPERSAVDLEVDLGAGGTARYSSQCERATDGTWVVVSIAGPGVTWPPTPAAGDNEGLSTSSPPG